MRVRILFVLMGGYCQGLVCNAFSPAPNRRSSIRVIESGPLKALPEKNQKTSVGIRGIVNDFPHDSFALSTTPSEGAKKRQADPWNKVIVSTICSLVILLSAPLPSHAGFGSGGAAVSSFPEIKPLSTEEFLKLSPKKQRQREFSVSCFTEGGNYCKTGATRLYEEVKQFNSNAKNQDALAQQLESLEERALASSNSVDEGARIQLEESLKEQAELLDRLGQQPPYVSYLAAAIGSIVSTLIMHPVDTIKVQLMNTQGEEEDDDVEGDGDSIVIGDASPAASAIDFANLYYKGIVANIFKEAPSSALYLGVYELVRTYLSTTSIGQEPLLVYLLAGSVGELFGSMLRAPAEAVKTRLQVGGTSNALQAAEEVLFSESGRNNLFQSWSTSLWRDIPMGAVQLAIFESVKTYVISSPDIQLDVSSLASEALFGAIGGSIGAFITTPADVITTISINSLSDTNLAQYKNKSPLEVFQLLYAEGGMATVFTGWKERTLYWTPAIGIFLSIYCGTRQLALSILG